MQVTRTQAVAYVGAGAATGVALTALRHGGSGKALALGLATGLVVGGVEALVQGASGSSELGWGAAAFAGAGAGALLLGGLGGAGATPFRARGVGAAIGAATGVLAPVVAGMILAQLQQP